MTVSSDPIAVSVRNLGKRYTLGERAKYLTLRDRIADLASRAGRRSERKGPAPQIWALRDVSFDVRPGEVVGVIGRNGAGKSTLLKILSRITDPTEGEALISGRVGSLLEVGTGFHHELTGRENIQLNGSILGMTGREISRMFDEIVAFAEVEKFIDTPVKRYSSGMYLRLAFSVAAHLQSEILLVDEVLAVGDIAFQRKCLDKMGDVAAGGRTVLFVSHNLGAVKELCQRVLVLDGGELAFEGPVAEGLGIYSSQVLAQDETPDGDGVGWSSIQINQRPLGEPIRVDEACTVDARLDLRTQVKHARLFLILNDAVGNVVVHQRIDASALGVQMQPGRYTVRVALPTLWLAPGVYTIYFKYIGSPDTGADERHFSERYMLEITGSMEGLGSAQLAPEATWSVADVTRSRSEAAR